MKNKVVCVVHGEHSRTGRIGAIVRDLGFEEVRCCNRLGDPLPESFEDIAGVCIFGGPMSANDDDTLPFIAAELAWIETVLAAQVPYLGICLGGQMLARTLGATVRPNPEGWHEIGYHRIAPTPCGAPLFGKLDYVYQWHGEGFELPRCCDLLATGVSGHFPNQAYRYGDKVFGLQFHPECTRDIIEWWMSGASEKLKEPGAQQAEEQIAGACVHDDHIDVWTRAFLTEWLDAAPAQPAARIAAS